MPTEHFAMTKDFMVDSNGYDYLVESEDIWNLAVKASEDGKVRFLMTQVQIDQIHAMFDTPKEIKAWNMLAIPYTFVRTSAFLIGVSKIGLADYGPPSLVDEIRGEALNDDLDALLADTARRDSVVLVTADNRLCRKSQRVGVTVWHPSALVSLLRSVPQQLPRNSPIGW